MYLRISIQGCEKLNFLFQYDVNSVAVLLQITGNRQGIRETHENGIGCGG